MPSQGENECITDTLFLFGCLFLIVVGTTKDINIDNHGYINTSILQIYRIYRRYIDRYFGKKFR